MKNRIPIILILVLLLHTGFIHPNPSATSMSTLIIPSGLDDHDDISNKVSYTISAYERKQMKKDIHCIVHVVTSNRSLELQQYMLSELLHHKDIEPLLQKLS